MNRKMSEKAAAEQMSAAERDLYAGLLEALYSRDGAFALDELQEVRVFLRTRGVEPVDYTDEHRAWFDVLPAKTAGTLRPALVSDGKVLKKGLAARGTEEM